MQHYSGQHLNDGLVSILSIKSKFVLSIKSKFVIPANADIHASKGVHARHAGGGRYPLLAKACISISLYQADMDSGLRQNDGRVLAVA
jgi:hypothetical protein